MKKSTMIKMATGTAALLLMTTSAQAGYTMKKKVGDIDTKLTFFGFAQLEAVGGNGMKLKYAQDGSGVKVGTNSGSSVNFRAQRIRLGWKYVAGKIRGKVFLDFNQDHSTQGATNGAAVPKMIKDAFIAYKFNNAFIPKLGVIKMPNGMGFTMPGWNLDIAERGFDKALVLERNMGLMISGRGIGFDGNRVNGFEMGHERPWKGFGYDVMIANQANRSKAVKNTSGMGGNSYAIRAMFDYTEKLHTEISYALSQNAGGYVATGATSADNQDYSNVNIGIDSNLGKLSLKAEYFDASNLQGIKNWDERVFTGTAAYFVTPSLELVTKTMQGESQKGSSADTTKLGNTYIGFNYFLSSPYTSFSRKAKRTRNQHKVVFNYILASGSGATEGSAKWSGLSGYRDNAFIVQYQFKF